MAERTAERTDPERLPRGRHGISREDVALSQRNRMLLAMAEAMAEKGYAETSVADVIRGAGVSRQTFYEQFSSKAECFAAAYEQAAELLLERMGPMLHDPGGAPTAEPSIEARLERTERFLGAYLSALSAEPALARMFLVEVYAAGPVAVARRTAVQERFAVLVGELLGARTAQQRFACEALVGAVSAMVTSRVAAGRFDELRGLTGPFSRLVRTALPAFTGS